MTEIKTRPTEDSIEEFINKISDPQQREDSKVINNLMQKITGENGIMWGTSIIGYGVEKMKYADGRELDWAKLGFSPRKNSLTLYVLRSGEDKYQDLLSKLGKHTTGKACLYIKRLSDINMNVLEELIKSANEK